MHVLDRRFVLRTFVSESTVYFGFSTFGFIKRGFSYFLRAHRNMPVGGYTITSNAAASSIIAVARISKLATDVGYWHVADIEKYPSEVRLRAQSRHECQ